MENGTQVTCEWCKFAKSDISMISKLQKIKTEDEDDYDQYDRDYFCSTNCRYMNDLGVFFKYFFKFWLFKKCFGHFSNSKLRTKMTTMDMIEIIFVPQTVVT